MNLENILKKLSEKRPVFHSEDDFKFSLSQELNTIKDYKIRLERPVRTEMIYRNPELHVKPTSDTSKRTPIDIVIIAGDETIPIELKYKTKLLDTEYEGERYQLTSHGAKDIGRYSFRKDIYRVEQYIQNPDNNSSKGYVIILTNENGYIDKIKNDNTLDKNYSFHNGTTIPRKDSGWNYDCLNKDIYILNDNQYWNSENSSRKYHWTYSNQSNFKLDLLNVYTINWKDYSSLEDTKSKKDSYFKYSIVEVTN